MADTDGLRPRNRLRHLGLGSPLLLVSLLACGDVTTRARSAADGADDPDAATVAPGVGHVVYTGEDGHVHRVAAAAGAQPEDVSAALERLAPGSDRFINTSRDAAWLVVSTERLGCAGWACLAIAPADLSRLDRVTVAGDVVHEAAQPAIGAGGDLIVFTRSGGPHALDVWALRKVAGAWQAPVALTDGSSYAYNEGAVLDADASHVLFQCSAAPHFDNQGTDLCVVGTDGAGFRVVVRNDAIAYANPRGAGPTLGDFAPDGTYVFESDWTGERLWREPAGGGAPVVVSNELPDDNSPCVLPDGRIASLWLDRPGGTGTHELKIMHGDGTGWFIAATAVQDIGMGCSR